LIFGAGGSLKGDREATYHAVIAPRRQPAIWGASHAENPHAIYPPDHLRLRRRQDRDFVAAVKAAGKPVEVAQHYNHFEMGEWIANPYGPNGRAALAMMKLA
jgi:hypothetical protein